MLKARSRSSFWLHNGGSRFLAFDYDACIASLGCHGNSRPFLVLSYTGKYCEQAFYSDRCRETGHVERGEPETVEAVYHSTLNKQTNKQKNHLRHRTRFCRSQWDASICSVAIMGLWWSPDVPPRILVLLFIPQALSSFFSPVSTDGVCGVERRRRSVDSFIPLPVSLYSAAALRRLGTFAIAGIELSRRLYPSLCGEHYAPRRDRHLCCGDVVPVSTLTVVSNFLYIYFFPLSTIRKEIWNRFLILSLFTLFGCRFIEAFTDHLLV